MRDIARMVGAILDGRPDCLTMRRVRDDWPGYLVIKGILRREDARRAIATGADAIVVSNRGGRQFNAAPVSIDALPTVGARWAAPRRFYSTAASDGGSISQRPCILAPISACSAAAS